MSEQLFRYRNTSRRIQGVEVQGTHLDLYPNETVIAPRGVLDKHPDFERVGPVEAPKPAPEPTPDPEPEPEPEPTKDEAPAKGGKVRVSTSKD